MFNPRVMAEPLKHLLCLSVQACGTAQLVAGIPRHAILPMATQPLASCASYHPTQPVAEG